jgi:hypothetical protein
MDCEFDTLSLHRMHVNLSRRGNKSIGIQTRLMLVGMAKVTKTLILQAIYMYMLTDNFSSRPTSLRCVSILAQDHGNHTMVQKYYNLMFHLIQSTNIFPQTVKSTVLDFVASSRFSS